MLADALVAVENTHIVVRLIVTCGRVNIYESSYQFHLHFELYHLHKWRVNRI